jgi:hypothetical protein
VWNFHSFIIVIKSHSANLGNTEISETREDLPAYIIVHQFARRWDILVILLTLPQFRYEAFDFNVRSCLTGAVHRENGEEGGYREPNRVLPRGEGSACSLQCVVKLFALVFVQVWKPIQALAVIVSPEVFNAAR